MKRNKNRDSYKEIFDSWIRPYLIAQIKKNKNIRKIPTIYLVDILL